MADGFHWAEFLLGICLSALCIAVYVGQVGWASRRKRSRRENVEAIQMVQDFNISKLKRLLGQRVTLTFTLILARTSQPFPLIKAVSPSAQALNCMYVKCSWHGLDFGNLKLAP